MATRLVVAGIWFLAALYAGSMLHEVAGLSSLVGPAIGLLSTAVVAIDPFHRLTAPEPPTPVIGRDSPALRSLDGERQPEFH